VRQQTRRRTFDRLRRLPLLVLVPVLAVSIWVTVAPPYDNSPPIRSDGIGYYAWTNAIIHWDFDFCQWSAQLSPVGALSAQNPAHPNRCENKYPPGLALLRLPVMGPVAAIAGTSTAAALNVSTAEEKASQWLSVLALLTTLTLIGAALDTVGVQWWARDVTLLAACFGTGLFHYATYDSSFTHVYSAALFSALLLIGLRAGRRRQRPNWLATFSLTLFISLIRDPDIAVLAVLVAAWLVWQVLPLPRPERLREAIKVLAPVVGAVVLVGAFQLLYTRWSSGGWSASTYGQESFSLGQLAELKVLFASNHGLFSWYPALFVMLAVALCCRRSRMWGLTALASVLVLTVIYGSWHEWALGGAMGQRGFVDIVPLIAFAGGIGLPNLSLRWRRLAVALAAVCTLVTIELMAGYWNGTMPFGGDTAHQYIENVAGSDSLFNL
jgi:hypothetical protein